MSIDSVVLLLLLSAMAVVVAAWSRVSYTLVLLILGLGIGASELLPVVTPSAELILLLFLPPLIFEAAFALDVGTLWAVRTGALGLAFPGVLVAALVGGSLVHWALGLPWTIALVFGALVAATDPVSVLATFRDLGVGHRLRVLVEGESLLNDGTALVLLAVLSTAVTGSFSLPSALADFVFSIVGGTVIGIAVGWTAHWLIHSVDQHLTEMAVSVAAAYGAFLAADALEWSGVLATIAAAMTLRRFADRRSWGATGSSRELLEDLWGFLAFVANAGLFLLIGLEVSVAGLRTHTDEVIWGVVAALVGRAVIAYGGGWVLVRARFRLTLPERHVLFWGGLRGAVALAGVLSLPETFPHREELLAMTYGAVLFTLIAQGLTIGPLVRWLGLTESGNDHSDHPETDPLPGSTSTNLPGG